MSYRAALPFIKRLDSIYNLVTYLPEHLSLFCLRWVTGICTEYSRTGGGRVKGTSTSWTVNTVFALASIKFTSKEHKRLFQEESKKNTLLGLEDLILEDLGVIVFISACARH